MVVRNRRTNSKGVYPGCGDIQNIQLPGEAESFREFMQGARAEVVG
jgi:hypothetical protein